MKNSNYEDEPMNELDEPRSGIPTLVIVMLELFGLVACVVGGYLVANASTAFAVAALYSVVVLLAESIARHGRREAANRKRVTEAAALAAAEAAIAKRPPLSARNDPRVQDSIPDEAPPEEEFWDKYNPRLEFPLSSVGTFLVHVLIGTLLVFMLWAMEDNDDHSGVGVKMMDVAGMDDFGDGSAGSGGQDDPLVKSDADSMRQDNIASLADPTALPQITEDLKKTLKYIDPSGNLPITAANAVAYDKLSETMKKKLLGGRQGAGSEAGTGFDNSKGQGPGGTGANSTLGRNMRWTLRFRVSSGRDYLSQLQAMHAKLLIPMPDPTKCILIEDIANPNAQKIISENDLGPYADRLKFADSRREAVTAVAGTLGLDFTPKTFFAVFDQEMEADLARKETGYRNRRAEDIEETVFKVTVRGGEYEVVVDEQKAKSR
jgi:hypothetical protein